MIQEIYVHQYKVRYEDNAKPGLDYLRYHLDEKECKVFFDQAKLKRFAELQDEQDRNYTLSYSPDGSYTLLRRQ